MKTSHSFVLHLEWSITKSIPPSILPDSDTDADTPDTKVGNIRIKQVSSSTFAYILMTPAILLAGVTEESTDWKRDQHRHNCSHDHCIH